MEKVVIAIILEEPLIVMSSQVLFIITHILQ